jgi:molecular chaperone HtpG
MQGQIRVSTENIFPIIKKFLYSEHDIFIRELVSNAVDASTKVKALANSGECKDELGELRIDITLHKKNKTITIADKGLGLTAAEADKYLNQIAFSGAEEFINKYKTQSEGGIIGHFGLGFYSSFMVSNQVQVISQSYKTEEPTIQWTCDGSPNYSIEEVAKLSRGTQVILHINDESQEFLDAYKLKSTLEKFCKFLPIPIYFTDADAEAEKLAEAAKKAAEPKPENTKDETAETAEDIIEEIKPINNPQPIWVKKPNELTDEDYKNFYKELYPFSEPPLFWIHLNVDYPFNLTGVLYFPKIKNSYEIQKDKIQLYCNQVFVTDEVKDIVPEFLMLLHGVIDSPDIPLNVSRSYLQGDPNVKKITSHITKKVADRLEELHRKEPEVFISKWPDIELFVKYGMITDDKFLEKAEKFFQFETAEKHGESKLKPLAQFKTEIETLQKNKEDKYVVLYTTDKAKQQLYINNAWEAGYQVVYLGGLVDNAFISNIEGKWNTLQFKRVDADITQNLINPADAQETVLSQEESTNLVNLFNKIKQTNIAEVKVEGLPAEAAPVIATRNEFMRRMKEMANQGGGMAQFYGQMPDEVNLTVNGNHPLFKNILQEKNEELQASKIKNLCDLALLSQDLLKGEELQQFIARSMQNVN